MPTYEYRCPLCEEVVEVLRGINSAEVLPHCSGHEAPVEMERVPSAPAGFIFRGSGFHATDYRRKTDA